MKKFDLEKIVLKKIFLEKKRGSAVRLVVQAGTRGLNDCMRYVVVAGILLRVLKIPESK